MPAQAPAPVGNGTGLDMLEQIECAETSARGAEHPAVKLGMSTFDVYAMATRSSAPRPPTAMST